MPRGIVAFKPTNREQTEVRVDPFAHVAGHATERNIAVTVSGLPLARSPQADAASGGPLSATHIARKWWKLIGPPDVITIPTATTGDEGVLRTARTIKALTIGRPCWRNVVAELPTCCKRGHSAILPSPSQKPLHSNNSFRVCAECAGPTEGEDPQASPSSMRARQISRLTKLPVPQTRIGCFVHLPQVILQISTWSLWAGAPRRGWLLLGGAPDEARDRNGGHLAGLSCRARCL